MDSETPAVPLLLGLGLHGRLAAVGLVSTQEAEEGRQSHGVGTSAFGGC